MTILIVALVILVLLITAIVCLLLLCWMCVARARRGDKKRREEVEYLLSEVDDMENDLADKCRKGFADLNTQMGLGEGVLQVHSIPLLDFRTFAMRILFPGIQDHPVLRPVEWPRNIEPQLFRTGLQRFESLLREKDFVRVMVHSMEDNRNFSTRDRCNVASLLTTALYSNMSYLTELLMELLEELINKNITRNSPKLLMRRTESVAEKLLANWLAFNLYPHLQGPVSVSMYRLFLGIKGHLEAGPVDVLTGTATNSLSEEKLLRDDIEHTKLQVEIDIGEKERIPCSLLDCDSITQAKIKLMDQEYKGKGFSQRPKLEDVEVLLMSAGGGALQLRDNDMTNGGDEEWRKINTLGHYNIRDGMVLKVVMRTQIPNPGQVWDYPGTIIYDFGHTQSLARLLSIDEETSRVYHLQKNEPEVDDYYEQTHTLKRKQYASEIYLPRLVATKRILQSYMDQMMDQIFPLISTNEDNRFAVPRAIKLLYDFLDEQAVKYGIQDPETIHTWKNNSVPLRFWVNILKNPEFLLDVAKSASLDSALSVISQAFIDSCSMGQSHITRDSPTNKLLYHKEVQQYKHRVTQYYEGVKNVAPVQKNNITFQTMEFLPEGEDVLFHCDSAVYGLFSYAQCYQEEIKNRLNNEGLDAQQRTFEEACMDISENLYTV